MLQISRRAAQIAPSATLAIDTRAKALKAEGRDVVGFGAGEPDFDTPEYVRAAAQRAIDEGRTRYTPVPGTLSLRKVIAEKFMKDNGLAYDVSQIIVSSGAKLSIFTALSVLVDDGDEVLIPSPYWVSYPEMVKMVGGVPVFVPCHHEDGFIVRPEEIAKRVTDKTKVLILNSPSNPLGCVIPRKTLEQIAALAVEKQFYVISDEIYEKLIYDGCEHVSIADRGRQRREQGLRHDRLAHRLCRRPREHHQGHVRLPEPRGQQRQLHRPVRHRGGHFRRGQGSGGHGARFRRAP